jgi:hypothetical protein
VYADSFVAEQDVADSQNRNVEAAGGRRFHSSPHRRLALNGIALSPVRAAGPLI